MQPASAHMIPSALARASVRLAAHAWEAVAAAALLAGAAAPWIDAPLRAYPRSWLAAAASLLVALFAVHGTLSRRPGRIAAAALAGLACCLTWLLHLALQDPRFWPLVRDHQQVVQVMEWSRDLLPGVLGREPTLVDSLPTASLLDRLLAALYFMGAGWWLALAGSVLLLVIAHRALRPASTQWGLMAPTAILMAWNVAQAGVATAAELMRERGLAQLAAFQYEPALASLDRAEQLDPQLSGSMAFRVQRGLARQHLGGAADPEAMLAVASSRMSQAPLPDVIALLARIPSHDGEPLSDLVSGALAEAHLAQGRRLLRTSGLATAAGHWERALAARPDDVRAMYLLALAEQGRGRYDASLAWARAVLAHSRHARLNAQLYVIVGDDLWKLGEPDAARAAYAASRRAMPFGNFRSQVSLGGF